MFNVYNYSNKQDLSYLRWCIDEESDLLMVKKIFHKMNDKKNFSTDDILELILKNPDISKINKDVKTNQGYEKSLSQDKLVHRE
ncbi:MAG: hypothetical protein CM1200mP13_07500 [Candidatus Pelagibacterales bacterium]|nr:MAG: hypothetical protein CM1200mP13_07500 [Pelagibacterales bacterium]